MAFKKKESTDYGALLSELKKGGPARLYMLWGEEDYLRESFFDEIKKLCLADGAADFNYHRLSGEALDVSELSQAVDAVPFMGEHSLIEVRNFAVNACKDEAFERLKDIFSDLPDYATVVLILPTGYEPDGRLTAVKTIKKLGSAIEFTVQSQSLLTGWIKRRFAALGKNIGNAECERLMFISGNHMTGLLPEIDKIASFSKGDAVTIEDIERLAQHIPEAVVFEMTDALARRQIDRAALLCAELLSSGEHPIRALAMIGFQMRRIYTARVAIDSKLGRDFVVKTHGGSPYAAGLVYESAARFSTDEVRSAVALCAEYDYKMKSSSQDDEDLLKELLIHLALGASA